MTRMSFAATDTSCVPSTTAQTFRSVIAVSYRAAAHSDPRRPIRAGVDACLEGCCANAHPTRAPPVHGVSGCRQLGDPFIHLCEQPLAKGTYLIARYTAGIAHFEDTRKLLERETESDRVPNDQQTRHRAISKFAVAARRARPSSRRFMFDIHDMGDASRTLRQLRPVTFRYSQVADDGTHPLQYGLIAEEIAEVDPGLVQYGPDGQVTTVLYHVLPSLLLNEYQRQDRIINAYATRIEELAKETVELRAELVALRQLIGELPARVNSGK
jgi:endosialidase-like protein